MIAKQRERWIILLVVFFVVSLPSVESIGLSGVRLSPITYVPGKSIANHYYVTDASTPIAISLGGNFEKYATTTPIIDNQFDLIINFPEEPILPGIYFLTLNAAEVAGADSASIGALTSVTKQFTIEVYSIEKNIIASLSAPSVNENGTIHFVVNLQSRTYSDIDAVSAKIVISNVANVTLAEVYTNNRSLPSLTEETITASFNTTGLRPASYFARAYISYDHRQKIADAAFRIGNMDLILLNYTSDLEQGFPLFQAHVFNNWGNSLRNVYATIILQDQPLHPWLQTPNINLDPWQEGVLEGIVKVDLPAGKYNGTIQLVFEGEHKEEPAEFIVTEPVSIDKIKSDHELSRKNMIIQALAIGMLILIALILFLLKRNNRKHTLKKNEL